MMALITCIDCYKQISDKAITCIHCGYPIASQQQRAINITYSSIGERGTLSGDHRNVIYTDTPDNPMIKVTDTVLWGSDYILRVMEMPNDNTANYVFMGWILPNGVQINSFSSVMEHIGDDNAIMLMAVWDTIVNFQIQFFLNDNSFFEDGTPNRISRTFSGTQKNWIDRPLTNGDLFYHPGEYPFAVNDNSINIWLQNGNVKWKRVAWTAKRQSFPNTGTVWEQLLPSRDNLQRTNHQSQKSWFYCLLF